MSEDQKPEAPELTPEEAAEKEAKLKANREARAARDAARAAKAAEAAKAAGAAAATEGEAATEETKAPSPNQPKLDRAVQIIKEGVSEQAVVEAYINERDRELPCLVIDKIHWYETAVVLKGHPELNLHYLRNVTGIDQETHLEAVYYLINLTDKQDYCIKVKTDRDGGDIPSVTAVWQTANWNEREIYDLLGITFTDHPDLRRIMLPDDWVGNPLRKDYEPLDPEV